MTSAAPVEQGAVAHSDAMCGGAAPPCPETAMRNVVAWATATACAAQADLEHMQRARLAGEGKGALGPGAPGAAAVLFAHGASAPAAALVPGETRLRVCGRVATCALLVGGHDDGRGAARAPWSAPRRSAHTYAFTLAPEPAAAGAGAEAPAGPRLGAGDTLVGTLPSVTASTLYTLSVLFVGADPGADPGGALWSVEHIDEARHDAGAWRTDPEDSFERTNRELVTKRRRPADAAQITETAMRRHHTTDQAYLDLARFFRPERVSALTKEARAANLDAFVQGPARYALHSPHIGRLAAHGLDATLARLGLTAAAVARVVEARRVYDVLCARLQQGLDTRGAAVSEAAAGILRLYGLVRAPTRGPARAVELAVGAALEARAHGALASLVRGASVAAPCAGLAASLAAARANGAAVLETAVRLAVGEAAMLPALRADPSCLVLEPSRWSAAVARLAPLRAMMNVRQASGAKRTLVFWNADAWSTHAFLEAHALFVAHAGVESVLFVRGFLGMARASVAGASLGDVLAACAAAAAAQDAPLEGAAGDDGAASRKRARDDGPTATTTTATTATATTTTTANRYSYRSTISQHDLHALISGDLAEAYASLHDIALCDSVPAVPLARVSDAPAAGPAAPLCAFAHALERGAWPAAALFSASLHDGGAPAQLVLYDPHAPDALATLARAIEAPLYAPQAARPALADALYADAAARAAHEAMARATLCGFATLPRVWPGADERAAQALVGALAPRIVAQHGAPLPDASLVWADGRRGHCGALRAQYLAATKDARLALGARLDAAVGGDVWRQQKRRCPWRGDVVVVPRAYAHPSADGLHEIARLDGSRYSVAAAGLAELARAPALDIAAPRRYAGPCVQSVVLRVCAATSVQDVVRAASLARAQLVLLASPAEWAAWCAARGLAEPRWPVPLARVPA